MKVLRSSHALLGALLLAFLIPSMVYGTEVVKNEVDDTAILLLSSELSTANYHELYERARFLDLPLAGDEDGLRSRLYAYYGLMSIEPTQSTIAVEQDFQVEIISADSMYLSGGPDGILLLEGNSSLSFSTDSQCALSTRCQTIDSALARRVNLPH